MDHFMEFMLTAIVILLFVIFAIYQTGKSAECNDICASFDYPESSFTRLDECKCLALMENTTKYYKPLNELLTRK